MSTSTRFVRRSGDDYDRIVMAEILVPDTPNVFGDYWTKDAIRDACYMFMKQGFDIDVEHDQNDVSDAVKVVESFIARPGDPDFIEGSWVIGMYIGDDALWQQVIDGEINGYSYEALVNFLPAALTYEESGTRSGFTEADIEDGHVHEFLVVVDEDGRTITGGTTVVNDHAHTISGTTVTDETEGHRHRFNIVKGQGAV